MKETIFLVFSTTDVEKDNGCQQWRSAPCEWTIHKAFQKEENAEKYIEDYKHSYQTYLKNFQEKFGMSLWEFDRLSDDEYDKLINKDQIIEWIVKEEVVPMDFKIKTINIADK